MNNTSMNGTTSGNSHGKQKMHPILFFIGFREKKCLPQELCKNCTTHVCATKKEKQRMAPHGTTKRIIAAAFEVAPDPNNNNAV